MGPAMSLLFLSLAAIPVCAVVLAWILAAYRRRCVMHPEVFNKEQEV